MEITSNATIYTPYFEQSSRNVKIMLITEITNNPMIFHFLYFISKYNIKKL